MKIGLVAASIATAFSTAAAASNYSLQLFQVDDDMYAYISNSAYNHQLILSRNFWDSLSHVDVPVDISSFVKSGDNVISFELYNGPAGYSYGYDLKKDNVSIFYEKCGNYNVYGCNFDQYGEGLVFSKSIEFTDGATSSVPEPASWLYLVAGFGLIGSAFRQARVKSVTSKA